MINMRILCIASLYIIGLALRVDSAEMSASEFKILADSFEAALKSIDKMSSDQLLQMADWADAISDATSNIFSEEEISIEAPQAPDYTRTIYTNSTNQTVMLHSPAAFIPYMKSLAADNSEERPMKRVKLDHAAVKQLQKEFNSDIKNEIYVHVVYGENYFENYVYHHDRIDAAEVMKELRRAHPKAWPKTLQKRLMLRVETNFRALMEKNPGLIEATKYVGLTQDDFHRPDGHKRDLNDDIKLIGSTKAKYLKAVLDSGHNVRMNALIYNLPKADLPLYEALMADIFPVQIFGWSARIADNQSKATLIEYKKWPERLKVLKKLGLREVVEEQTQSYLKQTLPNLEKKKKNNKNNNKRKRENS